MEKWKELCKKIGKDRIWICIIGGLLLLVVTYPLPTEKQENCTIMEENGDKTGERTEIVDGGGETSKAYEAVIEQRLSGILSQMDGAGEVKVLITFTDYGAKVVEKDVSYTRNNEEQMGMDQDKVYTTSGENTEVTVYTVDEEGNEIPFVQKVMVPKVEGVLVLTQGGNNPEIIQEMKEAIVALFGIEEHKIKIAKMKGEER